MKIYLDDVRKLPDDKQDWVLVRSAKLAISFLEHEKVTHISLDHDLGDGVPNGYDVVCWIERQVRTKKFVPPIMTVHSMNTVGKGNLDRAIRSINKYISVSQL